MDFTGLQYLVVGAGLSGLTVAERLACFGRRVAVVDAAKELGGLCAAYVDEETGIECHRHGTHVFHTDDAPVYHYISRFATLNRYRHRVLARHGAKTYPLPVNLATINSFYGLDLTPRQAAGMLRVLASTHGPVDVLEPPCAGVQVLCPPRPAGDATERKRMPQLKRPENLREAAIAKMGLKLYEAFIEGYSRKHWGADPAVLPAALADRIQVRTDYNPDYFADRWQGVPTDGYPALFRKMASNLEVHLGVAFADVRELLPAGCTVVWTGPIDEWFGYEYGRLAWRGVRQEFETVGVRDYQGSAVINHVDERVPYTRVHEFRHLHPERRHAKGNRRTVIAREYPDPGAAPAYPADPDGAMAARYRAAATEARGVVFCGRLATYSYLDMDEAVNQALDCAEGLCRS